MSKHPEDKVLDVIDQLVDESLKKPQDDYNAPFLETCEHCGYEWHGAANSLGCPGAFATDEQITLWRKRIEEHWRTDVRSLMGEECDDGDSMGVAGAVLGMLLGIGGGTAVFVFMPNDGTCEIPALTQTDELPPEFVDLGHVDQTSHDDLIEENASDQDVCDLDTPES